jgi:hypothetical protein
VVELWGEGRAVGSKEGVETCGWATVQLREGKWERWVEEVQEGGGDVAAFYLSSYTVSGVVGIVRFAIWEFGFGEPDGWLLRRGEEGWWHVRGALRGAEG